MRVGTSFYAVPQTPFLRDHPHACGDKTSGCFPSVTGRGSSPCVWGQAIIYALPSSSVRIIPMRVGTRHYIGYLRLIVQDHPHACGDKKFMKQYLIATSGSSPCVWGQATTGRAIQMNIGIIPMRVGTRLKKSRKIAVLQNQPLRFPLTFHRSFV